MYIVHSLKKKFVVKVKNTFFLSFFISFIHLFLKQFVAILYIFFLLSISSFFLFFLIYFFSDEIIIKICRLSRKKINIDAPFSLRPPKSYCFPLLCTIDVEDGA